jgi:hypothetical protein
MTRNPPYRFGKKLRILVKHADTGVAFSTEYASCTLRAPAPRRAAAMIVIKSPALFTRLSSCTNTADSALRCVPLSSQTELTQPGSQTFLLSKLRTSCIARSFSSVTLFFASCQLKWPTFVAVSNVATLTFWRLEYLPARNTRCLTVCRSLYRSTAFTLKSQSAFRRLSSTFRAVWRTTNVSRSTNNGTATWAFQNTRHYRIVPCSMFA